MSAVPAAPEGASRTLSIRGLKKSYVAGQTVLDGIDLDVAGAGIVAIIGPSGAGKSTLIRCINRLVEPSAGEIRLGATNLARLKGRELRMARRRIGMVFQEYNLVERLTVMENVLCGRLGYVSPVKAFFRRYPDADVREAFALLDDVGLGEKYAVRADNLSGGQRQRVGIARALIQHPDLLLADEPTSSLDPKTSVEIMELIGALTEPRGIPVLVNMHDVELARRFAKRVVGMAGGKVVFDDAPSALTNHDLRRIYGGEDWL